MENEEDITGAIDTSSGDESAGLSMTPRASAPPTPDDSGAVPVVDTGDWQQEPGAQQGGSSSDQGVQRLNGIADAGKQTPLEGIKQFPGNVKRIVSYLMGEGADHPQALDQAGAQVDPRGQMSPDERNVRAVEMAEKSGGPEAAWKLVQANRVAYNAKQAFAYAALNGTQQKRPDINAAIDAANQASTHVLDGSQVQFAASPRGVTATVKGADGQPQQIELSPDAFRRYLNVGGEGQWDKVMQGGVPATLQKLAQGGKEQITSLAQQKPLPNARARQTSNPTESEAYTPPTPKTNFGKTPSTINLTGSDEIQPAAKDETNYGAELEARAMRMFPSVSQERDRNQWMAQQEQRQEEMQNKVDVAKETGESRVRTARETGAGRVQAAQVTGELKNKGWQYASEAKLGVAKQQLAQRIAEMQHKDANSDQTRALKLVQTKMLSLQPLSPQEQQMVDSLPGAASAASQVTKPGAPQQPAPQSKPQGAQAPPVPGAKLYQGKWYTRGANGESVPVQ